MFTTFVSLSGIQEKNWLYSEVKEAVLITIFRKPEG